MKDRDRISPYNLTLRYKFKQTSDKKKNQSVDYWLIQCQTLQTYIVRIIWQTVRGTTSEIL